MNSCLLEYATVFPIKNKFQPVILTFFSSAIFFSKKNLLFLNLYASTQWVTSQPQLLIATGSVY